MSRNFPEDFLQEVLYKTDIVDIVSGYVQLKKKGNNFWGLCPFHGEKTASFSVSADKQIWKCFGCGKGGNAFGFVMELEHMSFPEAVEFLADKAGLELPKQGDSKANEEREKQRRRHREICKAAAKFYYTQLSKGENKAVSYCIKRGISGAVAKRFGMGFAPNDGDALIKYLHGEGFKEQEMIDSGLAKRSSGGKLYDFFFDRLMFPIFDIYGNVIAFGGRVLGDGNPKYLNSADSPQYNKKRHLYGLNIAKKNKQTDRLILVEGYMDVVTVSSYGIGGAVASLGTSLTKEQCMLIKRFTTNVYIAYDGDNAGKNAAIRASKLLTEEGILPRILVFKEGLDPDEFLKKYGADEFEKLIATAVLPYRFEIDKLAEGFDLTAENGRRDYAAAAVEVVSTIKNELDREDIVKYLAVKTGYSADALRKQGIKQHKSEKISHNSTQKPALPKADSFKTKAEALALKLALNGKREEIISVLTEEDFDEPAYKECFKAVINGMDNENAAMVMFEDADGQSSIAKIVGISDDVVSRTEVKSCIDAIMNEKLKIELAKCQSFLKDNETDKEQRTRLLSRITELQRQLKQN